MARARRCRAPWPPAGVFLPIAIASPKCGNISSTRPQTRRRTEPSARPSGHTSARRRGTAEGRRPAQRPDRRRSGRNRDDPRDAGRHHPDRDRRTLFGRIAGRRAAGAATVVVARGIVLCQESRAGQTAAGCAPSRLPRPPAHTGRGQADPVSPVQFLRDVFLGTAGSTIDVQRPGAERQPNLTAAGLRVAIPATRVWQPAAVLSVACDEQRADDPAHILCGPSLNSLLGHRPISKSRASYRNSRTNRSHRFACWPHADFAAN